MQRLANGKQSNWVRGYDYQKGSKPAFISEYQLRTAGNSLARFVHNLNGSLHMEPQDSRSVSNCGNALIAGGGEWRHRC